MLKASKKTYFSLLGTFGVVALIISVIGAQHTTEHTHATTATECPSTENSKSTLTTAHFENQIDLLMTNTWQKLESDAGVTKAQCNEYLKQHDSQIEAIIREENRKQSAQMSPVSLETKALIQEILVDFSINPHSVDIVAINSNGSPASADDYTVSIDEKNLKTFCPEAQRFIIAHEIAHLKNRDSGFATALANLVNSKNPQRTHSLNAFTRSIELRADITAMLHSELYTKGAIEAYQKYIQRFGDHGSPTHPRPSDRLKIAHDMDIMHSQSRQATVIT